MNGVQVFGTNKGVVIVRVADAEGGKVVGLEPRAAIELARDLIQCANHAQINAPPEDESAEEKKEPAP